MIWLVLIYLVVVGIGSIFDWAVQSRFNAFVFFCVAGFIVSGILVALALVDMSTIFELLVHDETRYDEINGPLWFVLSLLCGTAWAMLQVHRLPGEKRRKKR